MPHPNGNGSDPRRFCGDGFPWPLINELSDGDDVVACYLVLERRRAETRQNKPYLKLSLGDRTGTIDAFVWDEADRWEPLCCTDGFIGVRGRVGSYQDRLQLKVQWIEPLKVEEADLARFLPSSPRDRDTMLRELDALVASVEDEPLRTLLRRCTGKGTALGRAYRSSPAAKRNHHAYLGGLLEHSLSVAGVCDRLAEHYRVQGVAVDRDLLVTGALLHDVGKVRELQPSGSFAYTTAGQLLGHIVIGIQMVAEEAASIPGLDGERLLLLQHLVASHQGRHEWASPKVPQLLEALLLHYADDLDSKMIPASRLVEGVEPGEWTAYDRHLERSFYNPPPTAQSEEVEPVPAEEANELMMDLFRG